jgi:hypothetical protein
VGEQLLWLSIDIFDRVSVAGSLDPTRPNFALAWREFHSRGGSPLVAALASDNVEELQTAAFGTCGCNFSKTLQVVRAGGEVFETSTGASRELSILAVAAQYGAVNCAQFLMASGAEVGAAEVKAAFRGGNGELMRQLWDAFPGADPLELALEAVKSWNLAGLRWLLDHKVVALSPRDLAGLFEGACWSGSYACGSSVLGFGAPAAAYLRLLPPVGPIWRVLCSGLSSIERDRAGSVDLEGSIAAGYWEAVHAWLPEATEMRLIAKHEGRDAASVNAFIQAASRRTKTVTLVETENGGSICGGYLDVAWVEGNWVNDPGRRSFIFTLKNDLGVPPTTFAQKVDGHAAYMVRDRYFQFGYSEGFVVWNGDSMMCGTTTGGATYEAPQQGVALFSGNGAFRAARWELWEVM